MTPHKKLPVRSRTSFFNFHFSSPLRILPPPKPQPL